MICYDVEFPENVRAHALAGTDLLLVPTALMRPFEFVAESVVPVRAFENQLYVAYVNRVGPEGEFDFVGLVCLAGARRRRPRPAPDAARNWSSPTSTPACCAASREANPYLADRRPGLYGVPRSDLARTSRLTASRARSPYPMTSTVPTAVHAAHRRAAAADHHVRPGLPLRLRRLPRPPRGPRLRYRRPSTAPRSRSSAAGCPASSPRTS